jgi:hypothetical protein
MKDVSSHRGILYYQHRLLVVPVCNLVIHISEKNFKKKGILCYCKKKHFMNNKVKMIKLFNNTDNSEFVSKLISFNQHSKMTH